MIGHHGAGSSDPHQQLLDALVGVHQHNQSNARALAAALAEILKTVWRTEQMTQQLLDAVTGLTGNVQALSTAVADHDTKMQALLATLQAAISANSGAATDPDIATAIAAIGAASSSIAGTAAQINAESATMAAASVSPNPAPAAAPPAAPSPAPAPSGSPDPAAAPSS